jgi:hypothetical protein
VNSRTPSDTNRTYTSEIRFYQHSSLARLVLEGQPEVLVESGLLLRFSGLQDADEIREALDHRSDVVLGKRRRWTVSAELLLGRRFLSLDFTDPPGDDGRVRPGLERFPVAGESGITVDELLSRGLRATVVLRSGLPGLGE